MAEHSFPAEHSYHLLVSMRDDLALNHALELDEHDSHLSCMVALLVGHHKLAKTVPGLAQPSLLGVRVLRRCIDSHWAGFAVRMDDAVLAGVAKFDEEMKEDTARAEAGVEVRQ
eukprot:361383-Rhodomonas_salina.1